MITTNRIQRAILNRLPWHKPAPDAAFRENYLALLQQMVLCEQPANALTRSRLSAKSAARKGLAKSLANVRILGFGTDDDWRRNGLWAAFRRLTDFNLFVVPDERYPGCKHETEERAAKERDFLRFVAEEDHREGGVQMVFFSHSGRHISDNLLQELQRRGIWSVIMSADDKHQFMFPCGADGVPHQLRVARQADLYWSNWPLTPRLINNRGGNGWFAAPGADPDQYQKITCEKDLDVVFVGGCYGIRKHLVNQLSRYFKVTAVGQGWTGGFVSFDESIRLFSRAKVVLGISGVGPTMAVQTLKGRDFEVPMCGATYLTSYNSELADHFVIGKEVVCYSSVEDCIDCLAKLLANPAQCIAIGQAARQRCLREHTWDHRVKEMLNLWRIELELLEGPSCLK
jgi:hypothetical protein